MQFVNKTRAFHSDVYDFICNLFEMSISDQLITKLDTKEFVGLLELLKLPEM